MKKLIGSMLFYIIAAFAWAYLYPDVNITTWQWWVTYLPLSVSLFFLIKYLIK